MVKKGTILKTKNRKASKYLRFIYGIYDGEGGVYYFYKGEDESRIIYASLDDFSEGSKIYIDNNHKALFSEDEILERAKEKYLSDFGEYNEIINNSEHFAAWCTTNIRYSVETGSLNKEDDNRSGGEKLIDSMFKPLLKVGGNIDRRLGLEIEITDKKKEVSMIDIMFFPLIKIGEIIDRIFKI